MATRLKTLKDSNGDILLPRTSSLSVMMDDGTTTVQNKINNVDANINLKADKSVAQMYKLTGDDGVAKAQLTDANLALTTGIYSSYSPAVLNVPNAYGILNVVKLGTEVMQTFQSVDGRFFYRVYTGSYWVIWMQLARTDNAIVESGSNANGTYIKFGDGICIAQHRVTVNGVNIPANGWTNPTEWTKPVDFINKNSNGYSEFSSFAGVGSSGERVQTVSVKSGWIGANFVHQGINFSGTYLTDYYVDLYAIGRWK